MTARIGIVGCGAMGTWHARNLARQPDTAVVAVSDVVESAAAALAAELGAAVADGGEVASGHGVDAVVVASSDDAHTEYVTAAIGAGIPCFVEKPLGTTLAQAQRVLEAEVAGGVRLVRVGFMRTVDPAHRQVAEIVAGFGEITRVRCVHRNVDPLVRPIDVLFSRSLIHDVHTVRWLTGREITAVSAHVATRADGYRDLLVIGELEDGGIAQIEFEDGGYAYEVHVEVTGSAEMAATLAHPLATTRRDLAEHLHVGADWFGRFEDAYRIEMEEWAAAVRGEPAPPGPSVWDGYAAQAVVEAGAAAVSNGPTSVSLGPRPAMYGP